MFGTGYNFYKRKHHMWFTLKGLYILYILEESLFFSFGKLLSTGASLFITILSDDILIGKFQYLPPINLMSIFWNIKIYVMHFIFYILCSLFVLFKGNMILGGIKARNIK